MAVRGVLVCTAFKRLVVTMSKDDHVESENILSSQISERTLKYLYSQFLSRASRHKVAATEQIGASCQSKYKLVNIATVRKLGEADNAAGY